MTTHQTAMVLFVLGLTFLLILPDHTTATDKFFQTGGRFGKRHDERVSGTKIFVYLKCFYLFIYICVCVLSWTIFHEGIRTKRIVGYSGWFGDA